MNDKGILALAVILAFALTPSLTSVGASQSGQGYVVYEVTLSSPTSSTDFTVTETVRPGQIASYSDLVLQLVGSQQNLTYSRLVNASTDFFPYFPNLPNQSFSYSNNTAGYSINVGFSGASGSAVSFGGTSYQTQTYSFSFSATSINGSYGGSGSITTFPSTLVYGATAEVDGNYTVRVALQATNLSLSLPSTAGQTAAYSVIGISAAAAIVAVPLIIRRRRQSTHDDENKPLYWVD